MDPGMIGDRKARILVLNKISPVGLNRLPADLYEISDAFEAPDAVFVRSADMHGSPVPASVLAIGRAGAGTNNIPVAAMSARGVPVFNAPGANANAVKELVLAAMLMASRNLPGALRFVASLDVEAADLDERVEAGKKNFAGRELAERTLGVIGLGKIGSLVAEAAIGLGMKVIGYDPEITVDAAWGLPAQVRKAFSVPELLRASDFVTIHVPLIEATRHLINAEMLEQMRTGATLLNFARGGVVDDSAVRVALDENQLGHYVCDFPSRTLAGHPRAIALPHLGASTAEAEENCAIMVAEQLRDYLEHGNVRNTVNFPTVSMPRESADRIAIANANVPNMVGQISTEMAQAGLNIHNMINKSRGEVAYTMLDVDSPVRREVIDALCAIPGVLNVRYLPLPR
ncbi:MAG: phosphoglycerate dehydrogenase [Burkholderiaceae bacterium]